MVAKPPKLTSDLRAFRASLCKTLPLQKLYFADKSRTSCAKILLPLGDTQRRSSIDALPRLWAAVRGGLL
jgi:hypothetical protein